MTLTPILTLKCVFFHFCKSLILLMRCHQISSVPVCVELTEFLDNIFKMPIFKPQFNFFEILKPIWLSIMRELWPYNFFQTFWFKGAKIMKLLHVKNLCIQTPKFIAFGAFFHGLPFFFLERNAVNWQVCQPSQGWVPGKSKIQGEPKKGRPSPPGLLEATEEVWFPSFIYVICFFLKDLAPKY